MITKIKKVSTGVGGSQQLTSSPNADTIGTISDLFNSVKTYDKEFKPHPVNKILLNEDGTPKVFYLTADLLKKIPDIIADPVAITKYERGKTISVFGNYFVNNSPMMVGITISKDRVGNDIGKVRTFNARRDVNNLINDSSILYLNENKKDTRKWFQACGIQVPLGETKFGVIRSISHPDENVKTQYSIPSETDNAYMDAVKRGDTETASKMIEEAAEKERFYLGDYIAVALLLLPHRASPQINLDSRSANSCHSSRPLHPPPAALGARPSLAGAPALKFKSLSAKKKKKHTFQCAFLAEKERFELSRRLPDLHP